MRESKIKALLDEISRLTLEVKGNDLDSLVVIRVYDGKPMAFDLINTSPMTALGLVEIARAMLIKTMTDSHATMSASEAPRGTPSH